jgi:4-hydroxy-4-methyl-2-oxoglutarate aldolase
MVTLNTNRCSHVVIDKLAQFGVATLHQMMDRLGLMNPNMRPIYTGAQVFRHDC